MRRESWAWTVPWLLGGLAASFEGPIRDLLGDGRAAAAYFYVGVGLGWLWYRLHPRRLADRLAGLALLLSVLFLIPLGGGSVDGGLVSPSNLTGVGVLAGLVLTESWRPGRAWRHQRNTSMTSRETMRELR